MLGRLIGTFTSALAVGTLVVACATKEPTSPTRMGQSSFNAASSSTCSPDMTAPSINTLAASPNVLWPPNHKFVPVTISWSASDNCSAAACSISSVTSNEPVNGLGDGDTAPDWIITSGSTLLLRAERSGLGNGRVYTITVSCRDAAGNVSSRTVTVTVPHDQGQAKDEEKCTKDDRGAGDDKNGDRDLMNKCKHRDEDKCMKDDRGAGDDKHGDRDLMNKCKHKEGEHGDDDDSDRDRG